ncbi:MAG: alpha/beta hydrolase [Candidatus Palauibacterales bacterium]|nr:alpha/beta hydrolase [Candidatus Palauibacterales bacterium]
MHRGRRSLAVLLTLALTACSPATAPDPVAAPADSGEPDRAPAIRTYTYKTIGRLALRADVFAPRAETPRPVVVWLHGGTLIFGSRRWIKPEFVEFCLRQEYIVVSLDFRLAPETKVPEIVADIQDGIRWVREQGPHLFSVDPGRLLVAGNSSGGYLAMMTGISVEPRPTAIVSYWGYGEIDAGWLIEPHYHEGALALLSEEHVRLPDGTLNREAYYVYLRQRGLWTKEVSGFDPHLDRDELTPYCPLRNIGSEYPPILMVHGTDDDDVPFEASVAMAEDLARHGVPHELIRVPGAAHELDGGDEALVAEAHRRAFEFIKAHLQ